MGVPSCPSWSLRVLRVHALAEDRRVVAGLWPFLYLLGVPRFSLQDGGVISLSRNEPPMTPPTDRIPVIVTDHHVGIGGFGTTVLVPADATHGAYTMLEHTLEPGLIGAPPHRHAREDEVSYVLEGTLTVWRAGTVKEHGPGSVVRKPRGEWHTFWNAGDVPVRFLELISPPEFARYFHELGALIKGSDVPDPAAIRTLAARYGLEFDYPALEPLMRRHGLRMG